MKQFGGDVDYSVHGVSYASQRRTDPRIAALVHRAFGDAKSVLNVGAGAGSYEPTDRHVIAIEPSETMRAQRLPHLVPAIRAFAEDIPLDDQSVDASLASITIHQWSDTERGISELRRVTRGPIIILTFDGDALGNFWLADYAPEVIAAEGRRYPDISDLCAKLGGETSVDAVQISIDCVDGFTEAFYARPEKFLEDSVRRSQSAWTFVSENSQSASVTRLQKELESGKWDEKYGQWREAPFFAGSLRLIVSTNR